ncbi:hypothetical protein ACE1CD_05745 [Aerosakkonema sp. BLCC-F183]|uniref:hypothetical protein n=1 Tax=Aerosakkonema sp. BLCC-F183 TaxID=3342834 RepID=UPI0035B73330
MRAKYLLVSICLVLGFLLTAGISIARDPWALSGGQKNGYCIFDGPGDYCGFDQYPTRDKGQARRIAGFYIDPVNYTPPDQRFSVRYQIKPCNRGWVGTYSQILSSAGNNWIGFPQNENICSFRYSLHMAWGERRRLNFEMNYYLDY